MHAADATVVAPSPAATLPLTWRDRILAWRDRMFANPAFHRWAAVLPGSRAIAHRRAASLFDLCAGFAYTQTLTACIQLDLFRLVAERPRTPAELARQTGLPLEAVQRLVGAAEALRLLQPRSHGRVGLGPLGAPIAGTPGLARMIAHNTLLYDDLRDPVAVLRRTAAEANLARYYPYAGANVEGEGEQLAPSHVAAYSELMAETVGPVTEEVLDAYPLGRHLHLMDVGGGEGAFLEGVAARHPKLGLTLVDLPAVAGRAQERLARAGIADRVRVAAGDFTRDPLPSGADVVSLVRILLDHDDATVRSLLARVRAALPRGGTVLVAEALAGTPGAPAVGDVYFAWYLRAMGRGRARHAAELATLLRESGFDGVRLRRTRYPIHASVLTARAV